MAHKLNDGKYHSTLFDHCYKEINNWVLNDTANSGPFRGTFNDPTIPLSGYPVDANGNLDLKEWKKLAGMKKGIIEETDTAFNHDEELHEN